MKEDGDKSLYFLAKVRRRNKLTLSCSPRCGRILHIGGTTHTKPFQVMTQQLQMVNAAEGQQSPGQTAVPCLRNWVLPHPFTTPNRVRADRNSARTRAPYHRERCTHEDRK